jgi:predicted AAA+ superfamily ATPase
MDYVDRILDDELTRRLKAAGAVVIEGPKACGKTATARRHANSEVLLDIDQPARQAANLDPSLVMEGATPRLIDEWQIVPALWNHIRRGVDDRGAPGQFLLTGSASPADDISRHTGAGRIARLRMRPMSLYETGHTSGAVSLAAVVDGDTEIRATDPGLRLSDIAARICVGGWPALLGANVEDALVWNRDYLDEISRADIRRADEVARDPARVARVLKSLARNVSTEAAATTIAADAGGPEGPVSDDTVRDYLGALDRLMVVEDLPAWAPHLRSRSLLRKAAKRHFVDPSLAVAALGASPQRLMTDLNSLGLLFESLVVRDLRVYAQAAGHTVTHYRDNTGLEIDLIVQASDGRWSAFEVKLGGVEAVDQAAASLTKFAARVDTERTGPAGLLCVIVASGYGYLRDDGVAVVPVGALAP